MREAARTHGDVQNLDSLQGAVANMILTKVDRRIRDKGYGTGSHCRIAHHVIHRKTGVWRIGRHVQLDLQIQLTGYPRGNATKIQRIVVEVSECRGFAGEGLVYDSIGSTRAFLENPEANRKIRIIKRVTGNFDIRVFVVLFFPLIS